MLPRSFSGVNGFRIIVANHNHRFIEKADFGRGSSFLVKSPFPGGVRENFLPLQPGILKQSVRIVLR